MCHYTGYIIQYYFNALMRPHLEHCIQIWGSQHRKAMDPVGAGSEEAMEMFRELEHLSYKHRLRTAVVQHREGTRG